MVYSVLYSSVSFDKCIMSCIHHYSIRWSNLTVLKVPYTSFIHPSSLPTPFTWQPFIFLLSRVLPLSKCHLIRIILYVLVTFSYWLDNSSISSIPSYGCTTVSLYIYLMRDILVASKFWKS